MSAVFVVQVGNVGPDPAWVTITWPIGDREQAIGVMLVQAVQLPDRFGPRGTRRLRVTVRP